MITLVILYTRNLHNTVESFYKKRVTQNGILGFKDSVSVQYDDVPRHLIFINNYQILKWYKYKCTYLWCLIFPIRQWLKSTILKKKPHVVVTEIKNVSQVKDVKWPPHSNTTNWNTTTFNSNVKETWRARENISSAYFFLLLLWERSVVFFPRFYCYYECEKARKKTDIINEGAWLLLPLSSFGICAYGRQNGGELQGFVSPWMTVNCNKRSAVWDILFPFYSLPPRN